VKIRFKKQRIINWGKKKEKEIGRDKTSKSISARDVQQSGGTG
jgi:hypothetical protein